MLFNSIDFLFFFPFVVLIYFLIPKRGRIFWLLIASYYFYMSWNAKYAVLIGASTMLTYVGGEYWAGYPDMDKRWMPCQGKPLCGFAFWPAWVCWRYLSMEILR